MISASACRALRSVPRSQWLNLGAPAFRMASTSVRIADAIKGASSWKHITKIHQVQPASFTPKAFSEALYRCAARPGGYAAADDSQFHMLCAGAAASIRQSSVDWSAEQLVAAVLGLSKTLNPGIDVFLQRGSAVPAERRRLPEPCREFVSLASEAILSKVGKQPEFSSSVAASAICAVAHLLPDSEKMEPLVSVWAEAHSSVAACNSLGHRDIALLCSAWGQACDATSLAIPARVGELCLKEIVTNSHSPNSSQLACIVWGLAKATAAGHLSPESSEAVRVLGDAAKQRRGTLRPFDIGLISWGLHELGSTDSELFALLREEVLSSRMSGRIGAKNAELLTSVLQQPFSSTEGLGDGLSVRRAVSSPKEWTLEEPSWPYSEQHAGIVGIMAV